MTVEARNRQGVEIHLAHKHTVIGDLHVATLDGAICYIAFDTPGWAAAMEGYLRRAWKNFHLTETARLPRAIEADIDACLHAGKRALRSELVFKGTPFQEAVWKSLLDIPRGTTRTYGDIAKTISNPKAVRAVGSAIGSNPIPVIIPCHRVIGHDGSLTGFGGGVERKKALLEIEGITGLSA